MQHLFNIFVVIFLILICLRQCWVTETRHRRRLDRGSLNSNAKINFKYLGWKIFDW